MHYLCYHKHICNYSSGDINRRIVSSQENLLLVLLSEKAWTLSVYQAVTQRRSHDFIHLLAQWPTNTPPMHTVAGRFVFLHCLLMSA